MASEEHGCIPGGDELFEVAAGSGPSGMTDPEIDRIMAAKDNAWRSRVCRPGANLPLDVMNGAVDLV
jgi:hypothetical protein